MMVETDEISSTCSYVDYGYIENDISYNKDNLPIANVIQNTIPNFNTNVNIIDIAIDYNGLPVYQRKQIIKEKSLIIKIMLTITITIILYIIATNLDNSI